MLMILSVDLIIFYVQMLSETQEKGIDPSTAITLINVFRVFSLGNFKDFLIGIIAHITNVTVL